MLNLKENKLSYESLQLWVKALEKEIFQLGQAEQARRRENEYLTALHETSLGLIDHLDKEELLEAILQRAAMLTGTDMAISICLSPAKTKCRCGSGWDFLKASWVGGLNWAKAWAARSGRLRNRCWSMIIAPGRGGFPINLWMSLHSVVGIPLRDRNRISWCHRAGQCRTGKKFKSEDITVFGPFC